MKYKYSWDLLISIVNSSKTIHKWHVIWQTYWRILSRNEKLNLFNEMKEQKRHFRNSKSASQLCLFFTTSFSELNFVWNVMLSIMLYQLFFLNFALMINDILLHSDLKNLMRSKFSMKLMTRSYLSLIWCLNTDVTILKNQYISLKYEWITWISSFSCLQRSWSDVKHDEQRLL